MNIAFGHFLRVLWLTISLAPLAACAAASVSDEVDGVIEGQVVEEGTNKPIPGVIVVGHWEGTASMVADSRTVCRHIETATTDEQGRYRMARWKGMKPNLTSSYKLGYVRSDLYYRTRAYVDHRDILKPFTGGREERFESLWDVFRSTGCLEAGRSKKNLYPLYEAVYQESKHLAVSQEEKRLLQIMRDGAARAWVASDEIRTSDEVQKQIKEFLRDHLQ